MTDSNKSLTKTIEAFEAVRSKLYTSLKVSQAIGLRQTEQEVTKFFPITQGEGNAARAAVILVFKASILYYNFCRASNIKSVSLQKIADKGDVIGIVQLFALGEFEPADGSKSSEISDNGRLLIEFIHTHCNKEAVSAFLMGIVSVNVGGLSL